MANYRKSLKNPRSQAFHAQHGRCYYCNQPMWTKTPLELVSRFRINQSQAKLLQCTGEHLVSHSEGGASGNGNIVAACRYCNQNRHRRKKVPTPENYRKYVRQRLSKSKWHGILLVS